MCLVNFVLFKSIIERTKKEEEEEEEEKKNEDTYTHLSNIFVWPRENNLVRHVSLLLNVDLVVLLRIL